MAKHISTRGGAVKKVSDEEADKLITAGQAIYISKEKYKQITKVREKRLEEEKKTATKTDYRKLKRLWG